MHLYETVPSFVVMRATFASGCVEMVAYDTVINAAFSFSSFSLFFFCDVPPKGGGGDEGYACKRIGTDFMSIDAYC